MRKHIKEPWILMYIERWLKVPFVDSKGQTIERKSGTPQGGVISPVLANLFMHYAFDMWMVRTEPQAPFERYADDAIIHCNTKMEAEEIMEKLKQRIEECKLELHPMKTKIVYCHDKDRLGRLQFNFLPSVSKKSAKAFRDKIKAMRLHSYTGSKIEIIAEMINPILRGWLNYFTKYTPSAVKHTIDCLNRRLVKWVMCKYKRFRGHRVKAEKWLAELAKREPNMFPHWTLGYRLSNG